MNARFFADGRCGVVIGRGFDSILIFGLVSGVVLWSWVRFFRFLTTLVWGSDWSWVRFNSDFFWVSGVQ